MSTTTEVAKPSIPLVTPEDMRAHGYYTRPGDGAALLYLTGSDLDRNMIIIEGQPGVGKSEFAKVLSKVISDKLAEQGANATCEYLEYMVHSWTSNDDLFASPHIGNIAAGVSNPSDAYRPGILWQASVKSLLGPVVLLLDEFDKCQQRSEYLFLAWLQDGVVQDSDVNGDGRKVYANLENIVVVLTSNGTRKLHDATLRRALRYNMAYLEPSVEVELLRKMTGAPVTAIKAVVDAANRIRTGATSSPSLQEMGILLKVAARCPNAPYIATIIKGTLCKTDGCMSNSDIAKLAETLHSSFGVSKKK